MSDPFLWAHERSRHIFDISTDLKPGSIRDQVIRGTLLVHRARELGIIGPTGHDLLVVGAGAAGVAAAVTAGRMRIPTHLIDKRDQPFTLQRECETRYVEPTVYDWPATHWREAKYPWLDREPKSALAIHRRLARQLVNDVWDPAFADELVALHPYLTVQYRTKFVNFPPPMRPEGYRVQFDDGSSGTYSMIILAKGFGVEHDRLPDGSWFRSYRFWDTDELRALAQSNYRILISGGGDGALQDFLRLTLRQSERLPEIIGRLPTDPQTLTLCHSVSENRNACSVWCREDEHDHEIDRFMHEAYREHIDDLWKIPSERRRIQDVMRKILRDPLPRITMAHRCDHFTRSYPINRFLVLLIDKYVRDVTRETTRLLWPEREVERIDCQHEHGPEPNKKACLRQPHHVVYRQRVCALASGPAPALTDREADYDVILLRHGADPPQHDVPPGTPPVPRPLYKNTRQVLPYHLGHLRR